MEFERIFSLSVGFVVVVVTSANANELVRQLNITATVKSRIALSGNTAFPRKSDDAGMRFLAIRHIIVSPSQISKSQGMSISPRQEERG